MQMSLSFKQHLKIFFLFTYLTNPISIHSEYVMHVDICENNSYQRLNLIN